MGMEAGKILKGVLFILFSPLILGFLLVFLCLWLLFTITGIGPLINYWANAVESEEYERLPPDVKYFRTPQGYRLAVRFSDWAPLDSKLRKGTEKEPLLSPDKASSAPVASKRNYPVIIPNGLAATMTATGNIHDGLAKAGFQVISFDRFGVGYSDENTTEHSPTVDECVRDMLFVMNAVFPQQQDIKFIVLGPSMGAIVGQCFIDQHPDRVAGFLNMDGFPAAFENKRDKFLSSSNLWGLMGLVSHTGLLRLMLKFAPLEPAASPTFPLGLIRYQMNKARFYSNTKLEFPLMLDLASSATKSWGSLAINSLEPNLVEALVCAKPQQNGIYTNGAWQTLPRAAAEHGSDWATEQQTAELVKALEKKPNTAIAQVWKRLAVRVMNGRDYSYAGADSFYDLEMRDKAAAEGNLHALLAGDGARYAYPTVGHDKIFLETAAIVQCAIEIDNAIPRLMEHHHHHESV